MLQKWFRHLTDRKEGRAAAYAAAFLCFLFAFSVPSFADPAWQVIASARSETGCEEELRETYLLELTNTLSENGGVLHKRKYTEYSKAVLAVSSLGLDPRDIAGFDILSPLSDYDAVIKQGINGAIWALIAVDTRDYPCDVRARYVEEILRRELPGGGWNMEGTGTADPDVTAMALTALSRYRSDRAVMFSVMRAVSALKRLQESDGGYSSCGIKNSESAAQVVIALSTLGKDPFTKGGISVAENLRTYELSDGSFMHMKEKPEADAIATDQGKLALTALWRKENGLSPLFDLRDRM